MMGGRLEIGGVVGSEIGRKEVGGGEMVIVDGLRGDVIVEGDGERLGS